MSGWLRGPATRRFITLLPAIFSDPGRSLEMGDGRWSQGASYARMYSIQWELTYNPRNQLGETVGFALPLCCLRIMQELWFAKIQSATKPGAIRPRLNLQREPEFGQGLPGGAPTSLGLGTSARP